MSLDDVGRHLGELLQTQPPAPPRASDEGDDDRPPPFMATTVYLLAMLERCGAKGMRDQINGLARSFGATASELQQWEGLQPAIDGIAAQMLLKVDVNITPSLID